MRLVITFFLFLFPVLSFAASYQGEIFTWGYGELLKEILEAIRALVDNNGLSVIFKAAMGVAFLLFALKKATDERAAVHIELGKLLLLFVVVWYLFLSAPNDAKHRYIITDKVTGAQYVVEQVPTGIGEPLSLISNLEDKIAAAMEREFSLPNSITYRNSGFGFPLNAQSIMPELKTSDIYFTLTLKEFIENCTLYEIQSGEKDVTKILSAEDLLVALDPNGDTRLTKVYTSANPQGEVVECKDAYEHITDYVKNNLVPQIEKLAAAMLSTTTTQLEDKIPDVTQLFFNATKSARDYLQQNFLINMVKGSFASIAAATGLSESQLSYSAAVAKQSTNDRFITMGYLAKDYLPIAKGVLTALIVGLSWIIALLSVIFMDFRYLTKYVFLLLWLMLWTPILVIINYIGDVNVAKVFSQITNDTGQTITLFTSSFLNNKVSSTLAWLGYLVWVTPPLAYAIAKASEYGFVSIASSLSGMAGGGASAGASADVSNAQNPAPKMRVGDTTFTDMPGGGIQREKQYSYGGHSVDEKMVNMGSTQQLALAVDGIVTANANIGQSGVSGINVSSPAASLMAQSSIKENLQQQIKATQQHLEQTTTTFTQTTSSGISEAITDKNGFSIGNDKTLTDSERKAESKAVMSALEKVLSKDTQESSVFTTMKNIAIKDGLGFEIKKVAGVNGRFEITGVDSQGKEYTLTLTGKEAEAFREQFAQTFSKELVTNESAREAFLKDTSHTNTKLYSQISGVSHQLSESQSKLKSLEQMENLVKSKGMTFSQNLLNALAMDLVEEYKTKNPNLSDKEAVKLAVSNITDMIEKNTLKDEIKKRGLVDEIINQKGFEDKYKKGEESIKVNKSLATSTIENINENKENIKERGGYIEQAVGENHKSFDDIKASYDDKKMREVTGGNLNDEVGGATNEVNRRLNQSVFENFWEDNKAQTVLNGLAVGGILGYGVYKYWKANRAITPEIINDEKPTRFNNNDKIHYTDTEKLPHTEAKGLPYKEGKLLTGETHMTGDGVIVKNASTAPVFTTDGTKINIGNPNKGAVMATEVATSAPKSSFFLDAVKTTAGITALTLIDGTPLAPTQISDSSIYSGQFAGFAPSSHLFGSDTTSVVIKTADGKAQAINTDVPYDEMKNYIQKNPQAREVLELAAQKGVWGVAPMALSEIESPEKLVNTLKFNIPGVNAFKPEGGNKTEEIRTEPVNENKTNQSARYSKPSDLLP